MPRSRTLPLFAVAFLLILPGPGIAGASDDGNAGWTIVPSPSRPGVGQRLVDVAALSPTEAWAVGDVYNRRDANQKTQIQRWDGTAWSIVPSPSVPNRYNTLTGVAVASSSSAWAVGYTIADGGYWQTLIERWDGSRWSLVKGPPLGSAYNALTRVAAVLPDDVWAVGYTGSSFSPDTLVEHWDGTAWTRISSPSPGDYGALYGVAAISATDVWAVGYYKEATEYETLALHWDGTTWSEVETPNPTEISYLTGVAAVSSTDVWAVGYAAQGVEAWPIIQHWDGVEWTVVDSPFISGPYNQFTGVAANSATDVAAVGYVQTSATEIVPLVEEWDGAAWSRVPAQEPPGSGYNYVFGVASDRAGGYWAVGQSSFADPFGFKTYILRRSP